jgi:hypothetical protein
MSARIELYGHDGRQAAVIRGAPNQDARIAWALLIGCFSAGSESTHD